MKKYIQIIVLVFVLVALAACTEYQSENQSKNNTNETEKVQPDNQVVDQEQEKETSEPLEIPSSDIVYGPSNPNYVMDFTYNRQEQTMTGLMDVTLTNNIKEGLDKLYFNLWPNADVYKKTGGSIKVENVQVNGKDVTFTASQTHLEISGLSLKKNENVVVSMNVTVNIPEGQDRFGYYESTVSLGNWFPILAVYDDEGWNVDPYFTYGESFYSLTGNFDVRVTTDPSEVVVASGIEVDNSEKNGMITHHFKAENIRDFAMEMDPNYQMKTASVDGIDVNVYYTKDLEAYAYIMLDSGKESIQLYNEKFGKYPWPELDVVSMKGWFGGMEYPQLTMISFQNDNQRADWVRMVVAHEIGHQWFYGVLGDNEYDEPWLDESFASFAAALYMGTLGDSRPVSLQEDVGYELTSPVSDFPSDMDKGRSYYRTIYDYGQQTLNDLRLLLGDDVFYKTLQDYYKKKQFKISTTSELMKAFMDASDKDLTEFFAEHHMDYKDQTN